MAGIDKTYISSYEDYRKVINWCKDKSFKLKNGKIIKPSDFIYYPDITREEWNEWKEEYNKKYPNYKFELVLWNTPTYLDVWLIRNCPIDFIQERLKEQYSGGWSKTAFTDHNESNLYDQIKNYTSIYDTYQRNGLGKNAKIIIKQYGFPIRDKKCFWWIEVNNPWSAFTKKRLFLGNKDTYWYNENNNEWYTVNELMDYTSSCAHREGTLTVKNIVNLVKKWNFPKGTIVTFQCLYKRHIYSEYICTVK